MNILEKLSSILVINKSDLYKFIKTSPYRYKEYTIPKKNNKGVRLIAQPSKNLKHIQKIVLNEFLYDLPVHNNAVAYIKGIGIKENAKRHRKNQYMLKMDFQNFFPSIEPPYFINHIEKNKEIELSSNDKFMIKSIFFRVLPIYKVYILNIGSPSSPFISNTIMYDFDCKIEKICGDNITYTRYADDLIFSTNKKNILYKIPQIIEEIVSEGFYFFLNINEDKTIFTSKKCKRVVTGLVIDNDENISLGRGKKRYIKSLVHKFSKNMLSDQEVLMLKGYIAFLRDVEPEFYFRLVNKYGDTILLNITSRKNTSNKA